MGDNCLEMMIDTKSFQAIETGEASASLALRLEKLQQRLGSMSRAPLVMSKAQSAYDRGQQIADSTLGARFTNPAYAEVYGNDSMPQTADNIAKDLDISRSLVSTLYTIATLIGSFALPTIGNLIDKHGVRKMMTLILTCSVT